MSDAREKALSTIKRVLNEDLGNARDAVGRAKMQQERMPFDHDNNDSLSRYMEWEHDTQRAIDVVSLLLATPAPAGVTATTSDVALASSCFKPPAPAAHCAERPRLTEEQLEDLLLRAFKTCSHDVYHVCSQCVHDEFAKLSAPATPAVSSGGVAAQVARRVEPGGKAMKKWTKRFLEKNESGGLGCTPENRTRNAQQAANKILFPEDLWLELSEHSARLMKGWNTESAFMAGVAAGWAEHEESVR